MKGKNLIFIGLPVLAAGIALIFTHQGIRSTGVVITGGILFILAGILNLLAAGHERRRADRNGIRGHGVATATVNWLACAGAVILGVCMLIFKDTFVALIPFIFGILIAFTAFYQLYVLAYGTRPAMLPGWLYIVPPVLAGGAVYLFLQKPGADDMVIMLATGISLTFFGMAAFAEGIMLGAINRRSMQESKSAQNIRPETQTATAGESAQTVSDEGLHMEKTGYPKPEPLDPGTE